MSRALCNRRWAHLCPETAPTNKVRRALQQSLSSSCRVLVSVELLGHAVASRLRIYRIWEPRRVAGDRERRLIRAWPCPRPLRGKNRMHGALSVARPKTLRAGSSQAHASAIPQDGAPVANHPEHGSTWKQTTHKSVRRSVATCPPESGLHEISAPRARQAATAFSWNHISFVQLLWTTPGPSLVMPHPRQSEELVVPPKLRSREGSENPVFMRVPEG